MSDEVTERERIIGAIRRDHWALSHDEVEGLADALAALPASCPTCGGAGIVDTSPPGVETAPWLATDTDCPECTDPDPDNEDTP